MVLAVFAVVILLVVAAVVLGAVQIGRFTVDVAWRLVTHARLSSDAHWLQDMFSTVERDGSRHAAADKLAAVGAIFTALFTLMLWRVTGSMGRASQRQAAGDSPLLRIDVSIDAAPSAGAPRGARTPAASDKPALVKRRALYPAHLRALDKSMFEHNDLPSVPQRLVRVRVENVQSKPFAVARDVVVTVAVDAPALRRVRFLEGAAGEAAEAAIAAKADAGLPYSVDALTRRLELELLPPGRYKKRPLFDVGPLDQVEVSVIGVEYRDLRGRRRRRAAYGQLTTRLQRDGTIAGTDGYSRPDRWEMP